MPTSAKSPAVRPLRRQVFQKQQPVRAGEADQSLAFSRRHLVGALKMTKTLISAGNLTLLIHDKDCTETCVLMLEEALPDS
jgi:hypothetical protein